jgi:hypothetical protein
MRNLYDQPSSHPASSLAAEHVVIRRKHFLNGRQRVVFQLSTPLPRQPWSNLRRHRRTVGELLGMLPQTPSAFGSRSFKHRKRSDSTEKLYHPPQEIAFRPQLFAALMPRKAHSVREQLSANSNEITCASGT